jgi:hypothetical protein
VNKGSGLERNHCQAKRESLPVGKPDVDVVRRMVAMAHEFSNVLATQDARNAPV